MKFNSKFVEKLLIKIPLIPQNFGNEAMRDHPLYSHRRGFENPSHKAKVFHEKLALWS